MIDDINQLEKQQQPKITADRDRNNTSIGASFVGTAALGICILFGSHLWVLIPSAIVSVLSYLFMFILSLRKDQYEK